MDDLCGRACSSPALVAAFAALILAGPAFGQAKAPDISGTYWASQYNAKVQVVGGGELPLTAKGKEAYEKNMAGLKDGSITDDARKYCTPDGPVRNLATPYPFEIFQAPPGQVTIIHELNHQIRVVALDKPTPKYEELVAFPFYNGHAFGRWDGDTLVVETRGFNGKVWLDQLGKPSTEALHVTEKFKRKDFGHMDIEITIDDPKAYTKPWTVNVGARLLPNSELLEFICLENEKDVGRR